MYHSRIVLLLGTRSAASASVDVATTVTGVGLHPLVTVGLVIVYFLRSPVRPTNFKTLPLASPTAVVGQKVTCPALLTTSDHTNEGAVGF